MPNQETAKTSIADSCSSLSLLDLDCLDDLSRIPMHRSLLESSGTWAASRTVAETDYAQQALHQFLTHSPLDTLSVDQQLDLRHWQERLYALGVDVAWVAVRLAIQSLQAQQSAMPMTHPLHELDGHDENSNMTSLHGKSLQTVAAVDMDVFGNTVLDDYDRWVAGNAEIRDHVLSISRELSDSYSLEWCLVLKEWLEELRKLSSAGVIENDLTVEDVGNSEVVQGSSFAMSTTTLQETTPKQNLSDGDQHGSPSKFYEVFDLKTLDETLREEQRKNMLQKSTLESISEAGSVETKSTVVMDSTEHVIIDIPTDPVVEQEDKPYSDDFESLSSSDIELQTYKTTISPSKHEWERQPLLHGYQRLRGSSSSSSSSSSSEHRDSCILKSREAVSNKSGDVDSNPLRDCSLLHPPQHHYHPKVLSQPNASSSSSCVTAPSSSIDLENKPNRFSSILELSDTQDSAFDDDFQSNAEILRRRTERERQKQQPSEWLSRFLAELKTNIRKPIDHNLDGPDIQIVRTTRRIPTRVSTSTDTASRTSSIGVSTKSALTSQSDSASAAKKKKKKKKKAKTVDESQVDLEAGHSGVMPPIISNDEPLNKNQIKRRKKAYLKKLLNSKMSLKEAELEVQRVFGSSEKDMPPSSDKIDSEPLEPVQEEIIQEDEDQEVQDSDAVSEIASYEEIMEQYSQPTEIHGEVIVGKKEETSSDFNPQANYDSALLINEEEEAAYVRMISQLSPPDSSEKPSKHEEVVADLTQAEPEPEPRTVTKSLCFGSIEGSSMDHNVARMETPGSDPTGTAATKKKRRRRKHKNSISLPENSNKGELNMEQEKMDASVVLASPPASETSMKPSLDDSDEEFVCTPFNIRLSMNYIPSNAIQLPLIIGGSAQHSAVLNEQPPMIPRVSTPLLILESCLENEARYYESSSSIHLKSELDNKSILSPSDRKSLTDFFRQRWLSITDLVTFSTSRGVEHLNTDCNMVLELSDSEMSTSEMEYDY